MSYIVVKDFESIGCVCFGSDKPGLIPSIMKTLNSALDITRIQVVVLSNPNAYGEYAPYRFINDLDEFLEECLKLNKQIKS